MSTVLTESTNESNLLAFQWNWRLAQQAFAPLLVRDVRDASMLIAAASRSLSALSADERPPFERWLALQLFNRDELAIARSLRAVRKVDALLAAGARRQLPRVVAELLSGGDIAVAA
ncbi:MAG: hypothetical protein WBP11_06510 [Dokdonella sp.]